METHNFWHDPYNFFIITTIISTCELISEHQEPSLGGAETALFRATLFAFTHLGGNRKTNKLRGSSSQMISSLTQTGRAIGGDLVSVGANAFEAALCV